MFDHVAVQVECPYCGGLTWDGQTKDLGNMLGVYRAGDRVGKRKYIQVTFECHSLKCVAASIRRDKSFQGCYSGFGNLFSGKLKIIYGILTSELYDIKTKDMKYFKKDDVTEALDLLKKRFRYYVVTHLNEDDLKLVIENCLHSKNKKEAIE